MMLLALPLMLSAASLFNVSVDRTTVPSGQSVTFTIRTSDDVNYVFAEIGATRVQGTRTGAVADGQQNWSLVVQPAATATVNVFANTANNTTDAATVAVPVTVTPAIAPPVTQPPVTPVPPVGQLPAPTGGLAIHSITETPARAANQVQLTVVVGLDANEVWVRFADNRFRRGQEAVAQRTATTRTFVIDFVPATNAAQQVQVSANRTYSVVGATNQQFNVTLAAPFVRPAAPAIQQVSVSPRTVTPGSNTTFNIRTNADVQYVWVIDVDGNRRNANRTGQATATARNWTVSFNPGRTGTVAVYANTVDSTEGATRRTETVNVQTAAAAIIRSSNAFWSDGWNQNWNPNLPWNQGTGNVTVEVVTNYTVQRVWVDLPDGRRQDLTLQSGSGTGDRTWRTNVSGAWNWNWSTVTARVSLTNAYNTDASTTINIGGQGNWNWNHSGNLALTHNPGWIQTFTATPAGGITNITIVTGSPVTSLNFGSWAMNSTDQITWWVAIPWQNMFTHQGQQLTITAPGQVQAFATWW